VVRSRREGIEENGMSTLDQKTIVPAQCARART
jgi:hypothetical protein